MNTRSAELAKGRCQPCEGGSSLTQTEIDMLLPQLDGWSVVSGVLCKEFRFDNHYQTLAFVNALAWISHREDHHPELTVGYDTCRVSYVTHAVNGLSRNDFICAAKVDALFDL